MNLKSKQIIGGTAIFIALYTILFSGTPRFSSVDAERMLSDMSAYFSKEASSRNQEAKLQYSEVEIHGFAYEKWARVSNLSLDWMLQQWQGSSRFAISTSAADLIPDPINERRITLKLGDVINLIAGSELLARVEPSQPLIYSMVRTATTPPGTTTHRLTLPADMRITTPEPKRNILLALDAPVLADITLSDTQKQLRAVLTTGGLRATMGEDSWSARSAELHYDALQSTSEATGSKGTLTLDQLRFTRKEAATTPATLTAAWTMKEQHTISGATEAISLSLDQCLLADGTLKIVANGMVNFDIDDAAYGDVILEINDASAFIKSSLIKEDKKAAALAMLSGIMGQDMTGHKQAIINITRMKNGVWMVGKVPLAELLEEGFSDIFIFNRKEKNDQTSNPS